jgi:hypothetical protein
VVGSSRTALTGIGALAAPAVVVKLPVKVTKPEGWTVTVTMSSA